MALLMIGIIVILIIVFVVLGIKKVISKKQVVGVCIFSTVVVIALSFLILFIISSSGTINKNWKIKVTDVGIKTTNIRYVYKDYKYVIETLNFIKTQKLDKSVNLEEIVNYIKNVKDYDTRDKYSIYYYIELDDGTVKNVDKNDEYLQEFFEKIALNRAIY